MTTLHLTGLDGSNPLGYFAALGALEALTDVGLDVRLAWEYRGTWTPVLGLPGDDDGLDRVIEAIRTDRHRVSVDPSLALEYGGKRDLKPPPAVFRSFLEGVSARSTPHSRIGADFACAFATEVVLDQQGKGVKPTALHFTAGQQLFLAMVRDLAEGVTDDDVREALIGPWTYSRPLPILGWDATSTRAYALRASNPSGDKKLGVPGADWLAFRGLVAHPSFPRRGRVDTVGCSGSWKHGTFEWCLWVSPLPRDAVRSLVRLDHGRRSAAERDACGIGVVFSSQISRSEQGGYGSFGPARVA